MAQAEGARVGVWAGGGRAVREGQGPRRQRPGGSPVAARRAGAGSRRVSSAGECSGSGRRRATPRPWLNDDGGCEGRGCVLTRGLPHRASERLVACSATSKKKKGRGTQERPADETTVGTTTADAQTGGEGRRREAASAPAPAPPPAPSPAKGEPRYVSAVESEATGSSEDSGLLDTVPPFTFKELLMLKSLAKFGSIKQAAEFLYVSQSSVSSQLSSLEQKVKATLVNRHPGIQGASFTEEGQLLLRYVIE